MRRPTSIDRLPKEMRVLVGELRTSGRTIDEIMVKLREMKAEVSRSALGRHVQKLDRVAERALRSRHMAEALAGKLKDAPENEMVQQNIELLHGIMFDLVTGGEDGEPVTFGPKELKELSATLRDLTAAEKNNVERFIKATEAATKRAKEEAAATVAAVGARRGLSADVLDEIRSGIFGMGA